MCSLCSGENCDKKKMTINFKKPSRRIVYATPMLPHETDRRHCDVTRWSHHFHLTPNSYLASGCYRSQISLWLVKWKGVDRVTLSQTTLVTRDGSFTLYAFCPSHPCAKLTKHFDLTQVGISLFSNIEMGNGGAGTYSIGITVMSSCFCHFPPQFVHGVAYQGEYMYAPVILLVPVPGLLCIVGIGDYLKIACIHALKVYQLVNK